MVLYCTHADCVETSTESFDTAAEVARHVARAHADDGAADGAAEERRALAHQLARVHDLCADAVDGIFGIMRALEAVAEALES